MGSGVPDVNGPLGRKPGRTRTVIAAWLATRVVLLVTAGLIMVRSGMRVDDVLGNWDVQHYLAIALNGYADPQNMAFFPGLPLVMRGVGAVGVPMILGAALVSNASALAAALALDRLAGPFAAIAWLIAPMAVFTVVPYTEALFCALGFWAWLMARRGRWPLAAVLAAAACTVRVSGLFLVAGLAVLALTGGEPAGREQGIAGGESGTSEKAPVARLRHLAWLVIPCAVVAGFVIYLHGLTGSWQAWFGAQQAGWHRTFMSPWQGFQNTLFATHPEAWPAEPSRAWLFRFEIVSVVIGYLTVVGCLVRRAWAQALYVLLQVLALSCTTWFISVNRAVLLWFPLFIGIGSWAAWRPSSPEGRTARIVVLVLAAATSVSVMIWWAGLFYAGHWAS